MRRLDVLSSDRRDCYECFDTESPLSVLSNSRQPLPPSENDETSRHVGIIYKCGLQIQPDEMKMDRGDRAILRCHLVLDRSGRVPRSRKRLRTSI